MKYKIIEAHESNYPDPITIKKDTKVRIGKKYNGPRKWKNWVYCYTLDNKNSGWVPEQVLNIEGGYGIALDDYTAKELNVEKDDIVKVINELNGWL